MAAEGNSRSDLIKTMNSLQDTFSAIGGETVDLPQIVVVGSQSAGKSSVLETIVGRDFLPRGQGIVTRRPLVLQLVHTPAPLSSQTSSSTSSSSEPSANPHFTFPTTSASAGAPQEYGEFLHIDKRFYDFGEIRKEIENETLRVAGGNKGISRLPIHLKIYSPNVLNLTLVDLPGLTKIPVGDQPTDIERQIRNLVLDYVSKPNCVILAISPANVDLANSESLKLARAVDPQGRRTIGVLTKLDLMDAGTNALDILTGRVYPLKLGFIGVVGRSQQDINAGKHMDEQIRTEEEFFRNHPGYRNIAHRCGTKFLAKTLNQVLMNHIRDKLPDMKARLNTLMGQTQQELNAFGDSAFLSDGANRGSLILRLMTQFVRDFVASIDGTTFEISTKELCGGARIYYIFNDVFGHALESINPTQNLTTADIRTAIRNSTGPRPSLFVPEVAFDLLVKPQIKLLEPPSLRCVELVYEELMKICHNCTSVELQRYPRLHAQLIEVVSELLRERLGPTSEYVQSLISIQAAYINTNHPDFVKGSAVAAQESARVSREKRLLQQADAKKGGFDADDRAGSSSEDGASGPEEEDDAAAQGGYLVPNGNSGAGRQQHGHDRHRSTSSTVHDRTRNGPSFANSPNQQHAQSQAARYPNHLSNSTSALSGSPNSSSNAMSASAYATHDRHASAKESFLNYFFGGNPAGIGGPGGDLASSHLSSSSRAAAAAVAGAGSGAFGEHNPLSGRKGLEGNAAAFEMKSLEKHLEPAPMTATGELALTEREELETNLIRALIASYFSIVRQTIQDLVPKAIMHLLVNFSRESIQNRLVASLYKDTMFDELLHEDEALVAERTRIKNLLQAYREAFQTLSEVL
ncbi:dynamin GTPase [Rhodotorula toruloides]|uniref:dynamin GTPase n=1 Tax=Rhodotorula toruloides TaxID=5286 RepID=A0A511KBE0_RHOTO|nr:dynamin GTPase [Rhodotorula toruloides]